ncbi:hydrolase [Clostridia bacterium]|nr:hydrolase [Clostridia bacterium]
MAIRMIATDLDRTLLRSDITISDYTVSILNSLSDKGILVAFATSRSERSSRRFVERFNPDVFVSNGGAVVRYGGETIYSADIPQNVANDIIASCVGNSSILHITVESSNGYFSSKLEDPSWVGWVDYAHGITVDFKQPIDYGSVYKLTIEADEPSVMADIMAGHDVSVLRFSGEDWYQIKRCDIDKAVGIQRAAEFFGFTLNEVAAFGDDTNDLEMLKYCGVSVAVDNALGEIKAVSDHICASNDEDGVAHWLEQNLL